MMNRTGVYVHIPFCRKKCLYCDFPSQAGRDGHFEAYKDAVVYEIDHSAELPVSEIDTVFFGGGTPTVMPPIFLAEILEHIFQYAVAPGAEITVEANPGSVDRESLRVLRKAGFNRLSLGAQAWQDHLLRRMGRIHSADDIARAYEAAAAADFDNINLDLMFSLPGQSMEEWIETLRMAASLNPAHISAYSLTVEEGTVFGRLFGEGGLQRPDEDEDRLMYYAASDILGAYGLYHYEISNYALKGRECRHNIKYWKRAPYIGFGTDSHSFYDNTRWRNIHSLEKYLCIAEGSDIREEINRVTKKEAMEETMFLGLRLNEGVSEEGFRRAHGVGLFEIYGGVIQKMRNSGLMEQAEGRVFLTAKGRDVSNYVFIEFLI